MRHLFLSILLVLAFTLSAAAQQGPVSVPEWRGAILSGSQRLMLFSLLKTRPRGSLDTQKQLAERLGFFHRRGDGVIVQRPRMNVSPILEYDQNVNGGVPGDSFAIDRYVFSVNDESQAKAAVVLGARVGTEISLAYGKGSTLDFGLSGTLRHAPAVDVTRSALRASVCGNQYLSHWNWLVMCAGYKYDDARDIDTSEEGHYASVGLRRIFSSGLGSHEASMTATTNHYSDYDKLTVSGSMLSAVTGVGMLNLSALWGETVAGQNTVTRGANVDVARPLFGKDTRVSLGYYETDGRMFFGQPRQDRVYTLSLGQEMFDRIWVGVGVRRRLSSVALYNETEMTFDLTFSGWSF